MKPGVRMGIDIFNFSRSQTSTAGQPVGSPRVSSIFHLRGLNTCGDGGGGGGDGEGEADAGGSGETLRLTLRLRRRDTR